MIRLLGNIPQKVYLACSGGPDSMAVLDFLRNGRRDVTVAHFHHGTPHAQEAFDFVEKFCRYGNIPFVSQHIKRESRNGESPEEFWRNERYKFFENLDGTVITGHNLDDVSEWWIFSSLHGQGKLIPYKRNNVIRPFLVTPKSCLLDWCRQKDVPFIVDPSNSNESYMRSIVRHKIIPEALRVNPGLRTVLKKKIEANEKNTLTIG